MAINDANTRPQSTSSNTGAKQSLRDRFAAQTGNGRINDLLGASMGINDSTDALLDNIHTGFESVASTVTSDMVHVEMIKMPSNEQSPDSRLAYPSVLMVVSVDDYAICVPYLIVPGRLADFEAITLRFGQETMSLPRHPSEAFDSRSIADFRDKVARKNGIPPVNVFVLDAKCIHDVSAFMAGDAEMIQRESQRLVSPALRIATSTLLVTYLGVIDDVTLTKNLSTANPSHLSINYKTTDSLKYDEDNIPVGGQMQASVRVETFQGDNTNSLNRSQGNYTVGGLNLRAAVVHASGQGQFNPMFAQQGQVRPPMFTPQLIMEDLHVNGDPTPANIALMVSSVIPLINPEVMRRMFDPKDIGFLNTRANINGDGKPFAEKDVRSAYHQLWSAFFTNSVIVSMCVRLGSLSALYAGQYTRNGMMADTGVSETAATVSGLFGLPLNSVPPAATFPMVEFVPIGTYKGEDNQVHPLSDIDLLWLIRHSHARPQLIDMWAMSQDGSRDAMTSLALKMTVLKTVTNGSMKVIDRGIVFTFTPAYLSALSAGLHASKVATVTNIASITGMETTRWAPYMSSGSSVDFGVFQGFQGNMAPQQGGVNYGYQGYTPGQPF